MPYTADEAYKDKNFLYQLKKNGLIDHMTVSFFNTLNDNNNNPESSIKFGSMDDIGLQKGEKLTLLRTENKKTWDIKARKISFMGSDDVEESIMDSKMKVRLTPQLPYLYLPKNVYNSIIDKIEKSFGRTFCDRNGNTCKLNWECSTIDVPDKSINIEMYDHTGASGILSIPYRTFFNSGMFFGDTPGHSCHLAIFKHEADEYDPDVILVGNIFMRQYYFVYDMSPLEQGEDFI